MKCWLQSIRGRMLKLCKRTTMRKTTIALGLLAALLLGACGESETEGPFDKFPDSTVVAVGEQVAGAAFGALSGRLGEAIAAGGPVHAVSYCSEKALPITDSLSQAYGLQIRRTALRYRNPANAPSAREVEILDQFQAITDPIARNKPLVKRWERDSLFFYKPILTADRCLACHGTKGVEMDSATSEKIQALYPNDQAVGFGRGDLRGMWTIGFSDPIALEKLIAKQSSSEQP